MPTFLGKEYYCTDILKSMRIDHTNGMACAFGWVKAAVNTQGTANRPDAEVMDEIRTIIKAYKEADKQYSKELKAKL